MIVAKLKYLVTAVTNQNYTDDEIERSLDSGTAFYSIVQKLSSFLLIEIRLRT
jgi:hypothetical protein